MSSKQYSNNTSDLSALDKVLSQLEDDEYAERDATQTQRQLQWSVNASNMNTGAVQKIDELFQCFNQVLFFLYSQKYTLI